MIDWLRRLLCFHDWHHQRDGNVRTWTCTKCGKVKTHTDLPVPAYVTRGQWPPKPAAPPAPPRSQQYGHQPWPRVAPPPRDPEPDYVTPLVTGIAIGAMMGSGTSHASEPAAHAEPDPEPFTAGGGEYSGAGASSSWDSGSSSGDSGSSDSGGGGGGGE